MNEQHKSLIRKMVANARAIISLQVGLPFGCNKMRKVLYWLEPHEKLNFPVFEKYCSATTAIPTGSERLYCSRDALRRYDEKLFQINSQFNEAVTDACLEIIEKYGKSETEL